MVWNEKHKIQTQGNWLSRFTQCLSSSFAGLSGTGRDESSSTLSSLPEEPRELSSSEKAFVPHAVWPDKQEIPISVEDNSESYRKDAPRMPFPVMQMSQMGSFMGQSRPRLAGHIAKIRLETPPVPDTPKPMAGQRIVDTPREILDVSSFVSSSVPSDKVEANAHFPVASLLAAKEKIVSSHLLARNEMTKTGAGTQKYVPTGRLFKGNFRIVTPSPLCGSGEFACGQRDVVVKNPAVRTSSVIQVTLTSDPGPVVVHYVSLRPYEGFTVHLTAPSIMHATFNYMLFVDERTSS